MSTSIATLTDAARQELNPTGTLRVAVNLSNFLLVNRREDGALFGIVPDLAAEIARRLGAPLTFVPYPSPGQLADAASTGVWDVAFLGAEPARATVIDFTAAYLEIEATYLVPAGSSIQTIDAVDRPGVRISIYGRSAYDLYLTRVIQHATLLRTDSIQSSYDQFITQKLDALAGLLPRLMQDVTSLPGSRILPGRFTAVQQAIGTPRGRSAAAAFLRDYAEEIKVGGAVAQAIDRHQVRGVCVAGQV